MRGRCVPAWYRTYVFDERGPGVVGRVPGDRLGLPGALLAPTSRFAFKRAAREPRGLLSIRGRVVRPLVAVAAIGLLLGGIALIGLTLFADGGPHKAASHGRALAGGGMRASFKGASVRCHDFFTAGRSVVGTTR